MTTLKKYSRRKDCTNLRVNEVARLVELRKAGNLWVQQRFREPPRRGLVSIAWIMLTDRTL